MSNLIRNTLTLHHAPLTENLTDAIGETQKANSCFTILCQMI